MVGPLSRYINQIGKYNVTILQEMNDLYIYDFGIFTVNGEPNMGLGRFKENFGASGIFRDTIELKFNK